MAQRDTGWLQYYCEHGQESLDTVLQAYRVAEQVMLPAMVMHEAFYVTHALDIVEIPTQEVRVHPITIYYEMRFKKVK